MIAILIHVQGGSRWHIITELIFLYLLQHLDGGCVPHLAGEFIIVNAQTLDPTTYRRHLNEELRPYFMDST
jgi:hypothetical protein